MHRQSTADPRRGRTILPGLVATDSMKPDAGALAATLPDLALLRVLEFVAADNLDDVVSAGQVCRHWRRVASSERLWRRRRLQCHGMASEAFTRVLAFAPCLRAMDVCWINQISPEDRVIRKRALLASPSKLSRLTGVMCHRDWEWTRSLLAHHAAHLRELEVGTADREALELVSRMPRLRVLQISGQDRSPGEDPYLYPDTDSDYEKANRGLERLEVRGLPRETTISLLWANRRTLRKLTLNVGTPSAQNNAPGWPKSCNDLAQVLLTCCLKNLREITLTRYVGCFHNDPDCVQQRTSLRQLLDFKNVYCSECSPHVY